MGRRTLALLAVGAALGLALPAAAQAEKFCVQKPKCVAAGGTAHPSIGTALAAASLTGGRDRIELGPHVFDDGPWTVPLGNPVVIVGAGKNKTTLRPAAPAPFQTVLTVNDAETRVEKLAVDVDDGAGSTGILTSGVVRNVRVASDANVNQTGVFLYTDSRIERSEIAMRGSDPNTVGLQMGAPGSLAQEVKVKAPVGVIGGSQDTPRIVRSSIAATTVGVLVSSGSLKLDTVLVRAVGGGDGVRLVVNGFDDHSLVLKNATVVAAQNGGTGVQAIATGLLPPFACPTITVTLRSSIVHGFATALERTALDTGCEGTTTADLDIAWSALKKGSRQESGPGTIKIGRGVTAANPRFVRAKKGNYRLRPNSKLIDRGQPGKPKPGESKKDLDGRKRLIDGDGKRGARRDIGAYEFKPKKAKKKGKKR
ncbi:MAG TPA: hypothetical protein VIL04_13220 [Solirubrobacterales bacterium]|jgi:hypothetical protein